MFHPGNRIAVNTAVKSELNIRKMPTKRTMMPDTFFTLAVFAFSFSTSVPFEKPTRREIMIISRAMTRE